MRRKALFSILLLACAVAALLAASPSTLGKVRQMIGLDHAAPAPGSGRQRQQVATVTTATATTADFPIRRYAIGFVVSPAVVEIGARVSSQVTAIEVKDGQMVAAGDVLIRLDDRELKAAVDRDQATLDKDQALQVSAQADLVRARDLANDKSGTQQAYDQALAAEKSAAATVAADQAALDADKVQLEFATITAPIAGRLGQVNTTVGDLVGPNTGGTAIQALVTVTQMDPLEVQFTLPESELGLLQKGLASASPPTVTLHKDGDPTPIGTGMVDFVDSSVDTASGTISVKATVPNPGLTLWPGQYADIIVEAGVMPGLVSIPTVAVQAGQQGPFVFVVKPDETVTIRQVTIAVNQGDNSAVSKGLQSGERVVVEGQIRLTEGMKVREGSGDGAAGQDKPAAASANSGGTNP
ncbi:efflux RND transporter periplasmic adaptor subunit [Mesorhizobium sp. IMUNJ 23232]|uniref:efflux RND transporter periplasmic adaptor subunit n=1 Tax=Mesorhizobium sp. IMUNJ 23232 TaxID=3376064 RepID=UPI0037AF0F27